MSLVVKKNAKKRQQEHKYIKQTTLSPLVKMVVKLEQTLGTNYILKFLVSDFGLSYHTQMSVGGFGSLRNTG